ncbi:MAG: fibronectin type III domain-containing protein [Oscillospiraceae bacterium]|nr:fibronectin type III domain-containing protein [Oscillospiraceae bacterium]
MKRTLSLLMTIIVTFTITAIGRIEVVAADAKYTHITLTIGEKSTEIGISWLTPKDSVKTASVMLNDTEYTAVNKSGNSIYDTNKARITGLTPKTTYTYKVGDGTTWSDEFTFKTQDPSAYSILAVADPQLGSTGSGSEWANNLRVATEANPDAAFMLIAGDFIVDGNSDPQMKKYVAPPELRGMLQAPAAGNHDYSSGGTAYLPMVFSHPENAIQYSSNKGYDYYFCYGDVLYINIYSEEERQNLSSLKTFIKEAIKAYPKTKFRVATFHHDIFGTGRHAGAYYGDSRRMQQSYGAVMDAFDIDVVFNGHDHIYSRSYFMKGQAIADNSGFDQNKAHPGTIVNPEGTLYMSLGTAGDLIYGLNTSDWVITEKWTAYTDLGLLGLSDSNAAKYSGTEYTVMTVDGDNLILEVYRVNGDDTPLLLDSITINKFHDYENCILHVCNHCERVCNNPHCEICPNGAVTLTILDVSGDDNNGSVILEINNNSDVDIEGYTFKNKSGTIYNVNGYNGGESIINMGYQAGNKPILAGKSYTIKIDGKGYAYLPNGVTDVFYLDVPGGLPEVIVCKQHICAICERVCTIPDCEICKGLPEYDCDFCQDNGGHCVHCCKNPTCPICVIVIETDLTVIIIDDIIELHNPTENTLFTKGLYLSDNEDDLLKWQMPSVIIRAGESVRVVTDGNNIDIVLKRMKTEFESAQNDRVYLTDATGRAVSSTEI